MTGHSVFVILHLIALWNGVVWLLITVPAHLIYAVLIRRPLGPDETPTPETHVRCPVCRELVRADAMKCKHCGAALNPVDLDGPKREAEAAEAAAVEKAKTQARIALIGIAIALVVGALIAFARAAA